MTMNRHEAAPPKASVQSMACQARGAREIVLGLVPLTAALVFVLSLIAGQAQAAEPAPQALAGEKLDSGLGDLPHYSKWADPTGKMPMLRVATVGEKLDSGLGDLPHYSKWADPTGKTPMRARLPAAQQQVSLR